MMHSLGKRVSTLDRITREAVMAIKPIPHAMPARPFSRTRALWMCRGAGCSDWNAPTNTQCRTCHLPRTEP